MLAKGFLTSGTCIPTFAHKPQHVAAYLVALGLGRIVALHHRSSTSYTRFPNIIFASISGTIMQPNPRSRARPSSSRWAGVPSPTTLSLRTPNLNQIHTKSPPQVARGSRRRRVRAGPLPERAGLGGAGRPAPAGALMDGPTCWYSVKECLFGGERELCWWKTRRRGVVGENYSSLSVVAGALAAGRTAGRTAAARAQGRPPAPAAVRPGHGNSKNLCTQITSWNSTI
jgi:hypothetical protein